MALKDKKITEAGINQHGVVSAPDHLTGTPMENKKVFDRLVRALVAQSVNGLIDDLAGTGGAEEIGVSPINGLSGSNVQELLAAMKALLDKRIAEAGVASFKGRTGPVMPQSGDYTAAMVGAAPAGYGLGEVETTLINEEELNSLLPGGRYAYSGTIEGQQHFIIISDPYNQNYYHQTAINIWNGLILHRYYVQEFAPQYPTSNGFTPWEWVNPPMILGKEYRTTERYNGKPVYVKTINCGTFPESGGTLVPANIDNLASYVRATGVMGGGTRTLPWGSSNNEQQYFRVAGEKIWLYSNNPGYTATDAFITLYYTKNTD